MIYELINDKEIIKLGKNKAIIKPENSSLTNFLEFGIFVYSSTTKLVITSLEGVVFKSDLNNFLKHFIFDKITPYLGALEFFSKINEKDNYKVVYLLENSICDIESIKENIDKIKDDEYKLPDSPVICCPDGVISSIRRKYLLKHNNAYILYMIDKIGKLFNIEDEGTNYNSNYNSNFNNYSSNLIKPNVLNNNLNHILENIFVFYDNEKVSTRITNIITLHY